MLICLILFPIITIFEKFILIYYHLVMENPSMRVWKHKNSKVKVKIFLRQKRDFWTSRLFFHFSSMRGTIKSLKKKKNFIFDFLTVASLILSQTTERKLALVLAVGGTSQSLMLVDGSLCKHPIDRQRWDFRLDGRFYYLAEEMKCELLLQRVTIKSHNWKTGWLNATEKCSFSWQAFIKGISSTDCLHISVAMKTGV